MLQCTAASSYYSVYCFTLSAVIVFICISWKKAFKATYCSTFWYLRTWRQYKVPFFLLLQSTEWETLKWNQLRCDNQTQRLKWDLKNKSILEDYNQLNLKITKEFLVCSYKQHYEHYFQYWQLVKCSIRP